MKHKQVIRRQHFTMSSTYQFKHITPSDLGVYLNGRPIREKYPDIDEKWQFSHHVKENELHLTYVGAKQLATFILSLKTDNVDMYFRNKSLNFDDLVNELLKEKRIGMCYIMTHPKLVNGKQLFDHYSTYSSFEDIRKISPKKPVATITSMMPNIVQMFFFPQYLRMGETEQRIFLDLYSKKLSDETKSDIRIKLYLSKEGQSFFYSEKHFELSAFVCELTLQEAMSVISTTTNKKSDEEMIFIHLCFGDLFKKDKDGKMSLFSSDEVLAHTSAKFEEYERLLQ